MTIGLWLTLVRVRALWRIRRALGRPVGSGELVDRTMVHMLDCAKLCHDEGYHDAENDILAIARSLTAGPPERDRFVAALDAMQAVLRRVEP